MTEIEEAEFRRWMPWKKALGRWSVGLAALTIPLIFFMPGPILGVVAMLGWVTYFLWHVLEWEGRGRTESGAARAPDDSDSTPNRD